MQHSRPTIALALLFSLTLIGPQGVSARLSRNALVSASPALGRSTSETILYSFNGSTDGANPISGLIADAGGALYGTAREAGEHGWGTVFRLTPSAGKYVETTLHAFASGHDGATPSSSVVADSHGNLYGTTERGGDGSCGTAYELTRGASAYTERVIYSFLGGSDGCDPRARLALANDGTLYGTTASGGSHNRGTVFKLTPSSNGYTESVILRLGSGAGGTAPFGGVTLDAAGNLFGAAAYGGDAHGNGTVFELSPSQNGYHRTILHRFRSRLHEGFSPFAGLLIGPAGALFGTTFVGDEGRVDGTVFELQPSRNGYTNTTLMSFNDLDGASPSGTLIIDGSGALYGTTYFGGSSGAGLVFELKPRGGGYAEMILHAFGAAGDGAHPSAELLAAPRGTFYGTTADGGSSGAGTVFKLRR